ncbi:MAG: pyruvate kinase [Myxococcaceae bacterium]
MRKAKIICTLGPASDSSEVLEGLVRAGMNVARLNFSHGTHDEHSARVKRLRAVCRKLGAHVALLQDVQGPKLRLGKFEGGALTLKAGQKVVLTTRANVIGGGNVLPTPIRSLPRDVKPGQRILIDDGRVALEVMRTQGTDVDAVVRVAGVVKDHKGITVPESAAGSTATVTAKDEADLAFGRNLGVDYVALSFVRTAKDLERARPLVAAGTPIIAKVEKPQAVANLDEIIAAADGVMVARGDLGVELPLEKLPRIQKEMVRKVNARGRIAIVATEMLESMVQNNRPTRAEVSDVANAILDGADAVMLSGETAAGKYPVEVTATMARIVEEAERDGSPPSASPRFDGERAVPMGVAAAAVTAAAQLGIKRIVTYTESGYTARLVSEFRPSADVLALTPNEEVVRRVALYWGVEGRQVGRLQSTDAMLRQVRRICRDGYLCAAGDRVIIVAGVPLNEPGNTNLMSIHEV